MTKWCYTTYTIPTVRVPCPVLIFISSDYFLLLRIVMTYWHLACRLRTFHFHTGPNPEYYPTTRNGLSRRDGQRPPQSLHHHRRIAVWQNRRGTWAPAADLRRRASPACLSIGQSKAGVSRSMLDGLAGLYQEQSSSSQIKSNRNIADTHTHSLQQYISTSRVQRLVAYYYYTDDWRRVIFFLSLPFFLHDVKRPTFFFLPVCVCVLFVCVRGGVVVGGEKVNRSAVRRRRGSEINRLLKPSDKRV